MQEGMGPIYERWSEHLGASDAAVIALRRRLLEAVKALAETGEVPYEALNGNSYRVRSAALVMLRDVPWDVGTAEVTVATV